jgi:hypothetical protein
MLARPALTAELPEIGSTLEYHWRRRRSWSRMGATVAGPYQPPKPGSLEEFIVEHYWGYSRGRGGESLEYEVAHPPWRVAPAGDVHWDCDAAGSFGGQLAEILSQPPTSAVFADGSPVAVYPGRRL